MDKVHPTSLKLTPPQEEKYLHRNPLWDAESKTISLSAARGEIVSAQILLLSREGKAFPKGKVIDCLQLQNLPSIQPSSSATNGEVAETGRGV
ncbi:MAG: hypothetical protein U0894_09755 [Pirellulales bacterium]